MESKKVKFSELSKLIAETVMDEMAYPVGFNMKTLISLPSFAKRLQYCMQYLKKIGAGSSRVVFAVDNEKVLKVAKNEKGIEQNSFIHIVSSLWSALEKITIPPTINNTPIIFPRSTCSWKNKTPQINPHMTVTARLA